MNQYRSPGSVNSYVNECAKVYPVPTFRGKWLTQRAPWCVRLELLACRTCRCQRRRFVVGNAGATVQTGRFLSGLGIAVSVHHHVQKRRLESPLRPTSTTGCKLECGQARGWPGLLLVSMPPLNDRYGSVAPQSMRRVSGHLVPPCIALRASVDCSPEKPPQDRL